MNNWDDQMERQSVDAPAEATCDSATSADAEPQFGLVDVVDAFTALRHEYRSQIKEGRQLAEQLASSTEQIRHLEQQLLQQLQRLPALDAGGEQADDRSYKTLVEFDIQLTRAVHTVTARDEVQQAAQTQQHAKLSNAVNKLSPLARWFAKPLVATVQEWIDNAPPTDASVAEGLAILLSKLRESLKEHDIQRIDTCGQPFDGTIMESIGTMSAPQVPAGHVAEQLSPAYRRRQRILKFAQVRIAQDQPA
ncbi:MAG: nucleotide exchange factor GrpE [Pirellulaceae bacterium]